MTDRDEGGDASQDDELDDGAAGPVTGRTRVLLAAGIAVALLLIGAAGGLLLNVRSPVSDAPAPDSVAVGFSQDMTAHHRQAVLMASIARANGNDQRIRTLAFDIETGQIEQIGRMQGWLSLWSRDRLPLGGYMGWMSDEGHAHAGLDSKAGTKVAQMPGMASQEELAELRQLSGESFDVLFLQLMLRHHQGGAPMATDAADRAEVSVVRNLATKMVEAQGKEIEYMIGLLDELGAEPLALNE